MNTFSDAIAGVAERLVRWVILPVTGVIPGLARTGILFAAFAALWVGFFALLVVDPGRLDAIAAALAALPLPVQALAWLLFLPLTAGVWAWSTDWPLVVRLALVIGVAGWNLLVFLPRRESTSPAVA
ncbi:MAG TPA: hypothetical protein VFY23_00610 [Candidatus Limnocylindrales bacterium]|nr:hypothetical protein [Candidatus Limnocylindrales bacterium]